jgi:N-acetylglucosaminyldiphosphoundecaprenol N-acetyl-beta-D-mannosaminyltransferase
MKRPEFKILNVRVDVASQSQICEEVLGQARARTSAAYAFCNVHMVMEAQDHPSFASILRSFSRVLADGRPIFWAQRLSGHSNAEHLYGPGLMRSILETAEREKISVGFYGSSPATLQALVQASKASYPNISIAFAHSPPFRELTNEELQEDAQRIMESGCGILFVGLGCPRQEKWIHDQKERIQMPTLAVGAAFDFIAGTKAQAPLWMRSAGLEWLFRLGCEPKRLWKRYLILNSRFVLGCMIELTRKFLGIHSD